MKLLLWVVLAALSWPLALFVLILYPFIWLLSIPFRLVGISVEGVFSLVRAILTLPGRAIARGRAS